MADCLLAALVESHVERGYAPELARQVARKELGKSVDNYASALGAFLTTFCDTHAVSLPDLRTRFRGVTLPQLHETLTVLTDKTSSDAARRAWNALSHFPHLAVLGQEPALRKFLKGLFRCSKQAKHVAFFKVSDMLRKLRALNLELCCRLNHDTNTWEYKSYRSWVWDFEDHRGWGDTDPRNARHVLQQLRRVACTLVRLALVARTYDVATIVRFRFDPPSGGRQTMWVKMTRKAQGYYEWEPVVGNCDPWLCPVLAFRRYLHALMNCPDFSEDAWRAPYADFVQRTTSNRPCVWRRTSAPYSPVVEDTVASDAKAMMAECGVDTTLFTAHALRGAMATELIDSGVAPEMVMRRGKWASLATFNRYYNRGHQDVDYLQLITNRPRVDAADPLFPTRDDCALPKHHDELDDDEREALASQPVSQHVATSSSSVSATRPVRVDVALAVATRPGVPLQPSPSSPRDERDTGEGKGHTWSGSFDQDPAVLLLRGLRSVQPQASLKRKRSASDTGSGRGSNAPRGRAKRGRPRLAPPEH
jgi:hypothetical protein